MLSSCSQQYLIWYTNWAPDSERTSCFFLKFYKVFVGVKCINESIQMLALDWFIYCSVHQGSYKSPWKHQWLNSSRLRIFTDIMKAKWQNGVVDALILHLIVILHATLHCWWSFWRLLLLKHETDYWAIKCSPTTKSIPYSALHHCLNLFPADFSLFERETKGESVWWLFVSSVSQADLGSD